MTKLLSSTGKAKMSLKPTVVAISSSGTMPFSSLAIKSRRPDDTIYQKSYSGQLDESDALEIGKQQHSPKLRPEEEDEERPSLLTMAERVWNRLANTPGNKNQNPKTIRNGFLSDWLLEQPRGNAFAPFFFGGRDPFVFHDTFIPVVLARHGERPLPPDILDLPSGFDIQEKTQGRDGAAFYEITLDLPDGIRDENDITIQVLQEEPDCDILRVSSQERHVVVNGKRRTVQFDERFQIPPGYNVDTNHIQAKFLFDVRVLVLTLPQQEPVVDSLPTETNHNNKKTIDIPIATERHSGRALSNEEIVQTSFSDAFDESDWAEFGKRNRFA